MDRLTKINSVIRNKSIPDFQIYSYNPNNILLVGSHDLCYYHELEIEFKEVWYLSLPTEFCYPTFRFVTLEESNSIKRFVDIEAEAIIYGVEAETSSSIEPLTFYIVAETISVRERKVYYYQRENLQANEKIADWVK